MEVFKMKRHYYKIETPVTIALKRMRESTGKSLMELSRITGISASVIGHTENGRKEIISSEYIEKITKGLGYSEMDWQDFLQGKTTIFDLKKDCISKIENLNKEKLKSIHSFLESFAS